MRFWRKAGTWKPMLACMAAAAVSIMLFIFVMVLVNEFGRGGKPNSPAIILVIIAFPLMMIAMPSGLCTFLLFFERWAKEHYRLARHSLEWRRYVLKNSGMSETLALDDCATVEMFACDARRPTVGPWGGWWWRKKQDECRLAFYDTRGKCLAEVVGLTREEAEWMRGEFAAFLQAPEVVENKEVTQNAKKTKNPVRNVTSGQDWVAGDERKVEWAALFPVIFFGGMLAWLPFTEGEPDFGRIIRHAVQTPVARWDMDFAMQLVGVAVMGTIFLALVGGCMCFFIGNAVKRDTWRLDAGGFRYTYRTVFSRRVISVPLGRVLGFAVRRQEVLKRWREWLVLETAAGVMPLAQDAFDRVLADGPHSAAMRDAAQAGNRVLAGLKNGLPAENPGQAPAETRWKIIRAESGGVEFRQMLPFDWRELILPGILLAAGVAGVTLILTLARLGLMTDFGRPSSNHVISPPHQLWTMLLMCGMMAVGGITVFIVNVVVWRRHRFIAADRDGIRVGTVLGEHRREEVFPRAVCVRVTVENPGLLEPLPLLKEMEWFGPRLQAPPYALVLEDTRGMVHNLATGLTLEEGEWMLGEMTDF